MYIWVQLQLNKLTSLSWGAVFPPACRLSVCSPTEGTYAQVMRSPISHLSMHIKSSGEENLLSNTVFFIPLSSVWTGLFDFWENLSALVYVCLSVFYYLYVINAIKTIYSVCFQISLSLYFHFIFIKKNAFSRYWYEKVSIAQYTTCCKFIFIFIFR